MSRVRATQTFHHGGGTVQAGDEFPAKHELPKAFPAYFEALEEPEAPRRPSLGRIAGGGRAKPAAAADGASDG